MKQIAIIGGGASGALAAIHILRASSRQVLITIYEPAQELGAGLAYSTLSPEHILNVPAERMSCDEREPQDFVNWLKANAPDVFTQRTYPFVARRLFKEYLQARLKESQGAHMLEWAKEKVVKVSQGSSSLWRVETGATTKEFDHCVIATGYVRDMMVPRGLSQFPAALEADPYGGDLSPHTYKDVAIIGTSLTAIDIWRSLRQHNYTGRVHFVSRRGQFPQKFTISGNYTATDSGMAQKTPLEVVQFLREAAAKTNFDGGSLAQWLRPQVPDIWKKWSKAEKKQFLNHLRPYWDSIRHRIPDVVYIDLHDELKSGQSTLSKSPRLILDESKKRYTLRLSADTSIVVDKIFVATGARLNLHPFEIDPSHIKMCDLGQGFTETTAGLSIVGPPARTSLWETTAVPEIRQQAQSMAEKLESIRK